MVRTLLAAGTAATACGGPAPPGGQPAPLAEPCVFRTESVAPAPDTVRVVLAEPPLAGGDSTMGERFVARLLAPPAVEPDCLGRLLDTADSLRNMGAAYVAAPGGSGGAAAVLVRTDGAAGPPVVRVVRPAATADPRDQLDRGADILFTTDARTLAYARSHAELALMPVGPRREYYLVTVDGHTADSIPAADRAALAREAVRGSARPLAPPAEAARCPQDRAGAGRGRRRVVAYLAGDAAARQLAERIAALAGSAGRPPWISAELGSSPTTAPLATVEEASRVVGRGEVVAAVLPAAAAGTVQCLAPAGARVEPLVAVEAPVVVRRGTPPLRWTAGAPARFEPIGRP